jgi:hypothetical protein
MSQVIPITLYSREMDNVTYASGGAGDLGGTSSVMFKVNRRTNKIRLLYGNYNNAGGGEALNVSDIFIQAAVQINDGGPCSQLTFNGANTITVKVGQTLYSDWYYPAGGYTPGTFLSIKTFMQTSVGGTFPLCSFTQPGNGAITGFFGTAGDNYAQHTNIPANANGSNQILNTLGTSNWYSTNGSYNYGPLAVEGIAFDGIVSPIVGLAGDSIMQGSSDSADCCGGAAVRAMVTMGFPYYMTARGGESANNVFTGAGYGIRMLRLEKCSVIFESYGTNDLWQTAVSFATLRGQKLQLWSRLSQTGALIIPVTLLPRVGSTPTSSTTQNTGSNLGAYQAYNAWLRAPISAGAGNSAIYDAAQVGVTIPTIADSASYVETNLANATPGGPTAPYTSGFWWCGPGNNAAYSVDGTHPNSNGAILSVPAFTAATSIIQNSIPSTSSQAVASLSIAPGTAYHPTASNVIQTDQGAVKITTDQSFVINRESYSD